MESNQERSESEILIRRLYEITTHQNEGFNKQVEQLLQLGCERFNLEIGILSNIQENLYTIMQVCSPNEVPLESGNTFEFDKTYCEITVNSNGPVGFEHVKNSEINEHPAYSLFKLESYIGIPISVNGKIYGTLNFSSANPHDGKFRAVDIDALKLMAQWIEYELAKIETTEELKKANKKLEVLSKTDSLTSLLNRRAFQEVLDKQICLANRCEQPLSLIMIDVDHFKNINDEFGHLEGDCVIATIANILTTNCRNSDFAGRFGGEEFIVALPNTDEQGSSTFAESLRQKLETHQWDNKAVTISSGSATYYSAEDVIEMESEIISTKLIKDADFALYHSKVEGRNRVTHYNNL